MQEQRRYVRVGFMCELELSEMPGGTAHPARSLDLSLGGVGAVTPAVFPVGQMVEVAFRLGNRAGGEIMDRVIGRVVHLSADVDANRVGVEFASPLTEAEHPRLFTKLMSL